MAAVYSAPLFAESGLYDTTRVVFTPPGFRMVVRLVTMYTNDDNAICDFRDFRSGCLVARYHTEEMPPSGVRDVKQFDMRWLPTEAEADVDGFEIHVHSIAEPFPNGFDVTVSGYLLKLP